MSVRERMLVVVAHPDDETFGCGSLLADAAATGVFAVVGCATRGEAGSPAPGSGLNSSDLAAARERELIAAAELLGVGRVVLFDYVDSGMDGEPPPTALVAAPLETVAADVARLIDEVQPTVVVTLDGSDGHRDHVHIRDATLRAVERAAWNVSRVYLHCLPRELMRRWVEALRDEHPESDHLALGEIGTPEDLITTVIDTSEWLDLRERAIALHASQTPPFDVMPADLRREFLTVECLTRVRPPWTGGPVETSIYG